MDADRAALYDIEALGWAALAEEVFAFIDLFLDDKGDNLSEFLIRHAAEELARTQRVIEYDCADDIVILRHGSRFIIRSGFCARQTSPSFFRAGVERARKMTEMRTASGGCFGPPP